MTIPPGDMAPDYAFPAVARLRFSFGSNPGCTGTLIAPHVLLTARHCILDDNNRFKTGRDVYFRATRQCPEYYDALRLDADHTRFLPRTARRPNGRWDDEGAQGRDMALIRLPNDVPCADVRVARRAANATAAPQRLLIAGWGLTMRTPDGVARQMMFLPSRRLSAAFSPASFELRHARFEDGTHVQNPVCNADSGAGVFLGNSDGGLETLLLIGVVSSYVPTGNSPSAPSLDAPPAARLDYCVRHGDYSIVGRTDAMRDFINQGLARWP